MEFNRFINRFWNVFLKNICCYYKIEKDFLEKYEYELDWEAISQNQNINWSHELLEKFESRFLWHELAWNPSITWTTPLINRFKKRLDWYYLGRNISLPISKEFIEEHRKNIFVIENNKFLTKDLEKHYGKTLLPALENKKETVDRIDEKDLEFILTERFRDFRNPQIHLYEKYILPNLKNLSIESIFENKFSYKQRYFKLKPIQKDILGLTPEFKVEGDNPFNKYIEGRPMNQLGPTYTLVKGSLQEGKDRLYEMPRQTEMHCYPVLIISENIKNILESFRSTKTQFHKATIRHDKLKPNINYYILEMEYDSVFQIIDFNEITFYYKFSNDWFGNFSEPKKIVKKINSYTEIENSVFVESAKRIEVYPESYSLKEDYDIFTIKSDIIVNEFVKNKLEEELPNQCDFESAELLNIKINQDDYDKKRGKALDVKINLLTIKVSPEMAFFEEKMKRLKNTSDFNCPKSYNKDELAEFENRNGIFFSENFRVLYSSGLNSEEYNLLKVDDFYFQDEYQERYPETFRSVVIAENGCGDSLGLILKKDSDYQLDDILIEFLHETGEIKKKSNISPTMYIGNGGDSGSSNTSAFKKLFNKLKGK